MSLLSLLFPPFCVGCGRIGSMICDHCQKQMYPIKPQETICPMCERSAFDGKTHPKCKTKYALDGLISFFHYRSVTKRAVKELKYRYVKDIAEVIMHYVPNELLLEIHRRVSSLAVIVPVPLYNHKLRFRGFNQSEVFARHIGIRLNMPIIKSLLLRKINTASQTTFKSRYERISNMKHVFTCNQQCEHKEIILVDDIFTTGATMKDACRALKQAGAKVVIGVTIAR